MSNTCCYGNEPPLLFLVVDAFLENCIDCMIHYHWYKMVWVVNPDLLPPLGTLTYVHRTPLLCTS